MSEGERQRESIKRLVRVTGQDVLLDGLPFRALVSAQSTTLAYRYFDAATVRTWARPAFLFTIPGDFIGGTIPGDVAVCIETNALGGTWTVRGVFPVTLSNTIKETLVFVARPA